MKSFYSKIVEYGNMDDEYSNVFSFGNGPLDVIRMYQRMECIAPHRLLEFADTPALSDEMIQDVIDHIVV